MDTENRRQQIAFHQQHLRDEASAQRLARGNQDRFSSPHTTTRIPRTFGAWRRLIGAAGA